MTVLALIMAALLVGTLFVCELCSMLMTAEMVLIMVLALPIYLYKRRQPIVWCNFFFIMTLAVVSRFLTSAYVIANAPVVRYPIEIANENIRQFAGFGMIAVWFLWYVLVFASTMFDNNVIVKKAVYVNDVSSEYNRGTIRINKNLFDSTSAMLCINFIATIFVYKFKTVIISVLVNIAIVLITNIVYEKWLTAIINSRIEDICETSDKHSSDMLVYDTESDKKSCSKEN